MCSLRCISGHAHIHSELLQRGVRKGDIRRMPQCPHCDYYFIDDCEYDGHLTVFHPRTEDARHAAVRLVQSAKQRPKQKPIEREQRPLVSPGRSEHLTRHMEREEHRLYGPQQQQQQWQPLGAATPASLPALPPPATTTHPEGAPGHGGGAMQMLPMSSGQVPVPAYQPSYAESVIEMQARRTAIVQRDMDLYRQQQELKQLEFEADLRAKLEREYTQKRKADLRKHCHDTHEALVSKKQHDAVQQLQRNRRRRAEQERRIESKIANELEPSIRGLLSKGLMAPATVSPRRQRGPGTPPRVRQAAVAPGVDSPLSPQPARSGTAPGAHHPTSPPSAPRPPPAAGAHGAPAPFIVSAGVRHVIAPPSPLGTQPALQPLRRTEQQPWHQQQPTYLQQEPLSSQAQQVFDTAPRPEAYPAAGRNIGII